MGTPAAFRNMPPPILRLFPRLFRPRRPKRPGRGSTVTSIVSRVSSPGYRLPGAAASRAGRIGSDSLGDRRRVGPGEWVRTRTRRSGKCAGRQEQPGAVSSTYFHRRVNHMIDFSRPPDRKRRAGDVRTSSSGGDALRRPRKATLRAALQALTLSSRGPCDGPASRRTTLRA